MASSISAFFGVLKDLDWNAKEESMKAFRESFKRCLLRQTREK